LFDFHFHGQTVAVPPKAPFDVPSAHGPEPRNNIFDRPSQ
jgi:hypothetical protein